MQDLSCLALAKQVLHSTSTLIMKISYDIHLATFEHRKTLCRHEHGN